MQFPPVPYTPAPYRPLPPDQRVTLYYRLTRESHERVQAQLRETQAALQAASEYAAAVSRSESAIAALQALPEDASEARRVGAQERVRAAAQALRDVAPKADAVAQLGTALDALLSESVCWVQLGPNQRLTPPPASAEPADHARFWGALHPTVPQEMLVAMVQGRVDADAPKG
jgi:hypothetical protein